MAKGQKLQLPESAVPAVKQRFEVNDRVVERLAAGENAESRITTIVAVDGAIATTAEGVEYDVLTGGRLDRTSPYRAIRFAPSGEINEPTPDA